jgi:hypothetical protein
MLLIDVLMGETAQRLMSREQYYSVNPAASPLDTMSLFDPVR